MITRGKLQFVREGMRDRLTLDGKTVFDGEYLVMDGVLGPILVCLRHDEMATQPIKCIPKVRFCAKGNDDLDFAWAPTEEQIAAARFAWPTDRQMETFSRQLAFG